MDNYKLKIELVPKTCWFSNLRKELTQEEWDRVRKYTYDLSKDHCCMICGAKGRLSAHEIWEYDEACHIQKLIGLIALCDDCHMVKHIGFAQLQGKYDAAVNHFRKVNNQKTDDLFNKKMQEARESYIRRSEITDWKLDISYLKDIGFEDIFYKHYKAYDTDDLF